MSFEDYFSWLPVFSNEKGRPFVFWFACKTLLILGDGGQALIIEFDDHSYANPLATMRLRRIHKDGTICDKYGNVLARYDAVSNGVTIKCRDREYVFHSNYYLRKVRLISLI